MIDRKPKNIFRRGLTLLRKALFRNISQTIENNIVNSAVYLLLLAFEMVQTAPFFLIIGLRVADKDPDAYPRFEPTMTAFTTYTGSNAILSANFTVLMVATFAFLPIYAVRMVLMMYMEANSKEKGPANYKFMPCIYKVVSALIVIINLVLIWPIYLLQVMPFHCTYTSSRVYLSSQSDVTCWTGLHLAVVIVNGINVLLAMIDVVIYETLFNDTSPHSRIPWACTQANKMLLLKHMGKMVLACFTVFDSSAGYYDYLFVLEIVVHGLIVYVLFMSPAFINRICGRTVLFYESFLLFVAIASYVLRMCDVVLLQIGFLMLIVLILTLSGLTVFAKSMYDQYIVTIQLSSTKNESTKEYYFYEFFRLLDQYGTNDPGVAIDLYGIYSNHQLTCVNPACSCRSELLNKNIDEIKKRGEGETGRTPEAEAQYEGILSSSRSNMASMLQIAPSKSLDDLQAHGEDHSDKEDGKENAPDNLDILLRMCCSQIDCEVTKNIGSVALRMISAYYSREYMGNLFRTIYELAFIEEKQKPSLSDRFHIYKYKTMIEEELAVLSKKGTEDHGVDVEKLIEFERHYETFREQVESASNVANNFWQQLKNKELDVNGLYDIGSKVGSLYSDMLRNYNAAIGIFPHNYKLASEFGQFERAIMNNEILARSYEQKARQVAKEQAEQNREGKEDDIADVNSVRHTCICVVSGNPNTMGDIVSVNNEITFCLGFKPKELVGQNCGILCPPYIAVQHNPMIENFIKRGTSSFLKAKRVIMGFNSQGFLVLMEAFIKVLPSITNGIKFLGIFRPFEDYAAFMKEKLTFSPADFAFMVTSMDGQILGISEGCMNRLGIPVSLLKPKGVAEEAVLIQSLIKELGEVETEEQLLTEGKKVNLDSKVLQVSINQENLCRKEVKALEEKAGRYRIFLKQSNESYGQGLVQIKVYKMIIITPENERVMPTRDLSRNSAALGTESPHRSTIMNQLRGGYRVSVLQKIVDKDGEDEALASNNIRSLFEYKQNMNAASATINVTAIKRNIGIMFLLMIITACVEFGLLITEQSRYVSGLDTVFITSRRVIDIGMIHSQVLAMVRMANQSSSATLVSGINMYEYLREYGFRSIGTLGNEQDSLNTMDFDYTAALSALEKSASVPILTLGMNGVQSTTNFTINTAVTQYIAKASDFMSYEFPALKSALISANSSSTILTEYFLIKENGIGSLAKTTQEAEELFRTAVEDRTGSFVPYFIGVAAIMAVILAASFSSLVPKLVDLQCEKINVLTLYTQMNRREIDVQMSKCVEYQRKNGFLDLTDETESGMGPTRGDSNDADAEGKGTVNVLREIKNCIVKAVVKGRLEAIRRKRLSDQKQQEEKEKSSSSSERSENSDSDAESKEEQPPRDENEIAIHEQLDPAQLRARLTTNKGSLIALVVMIATLYCSYFVVCAVKPTYDASDFKDGLEYMSRLSSMFKSPLYLVLFSLVSVYEQRTMYVDGEEAIGALLKRFIASNEFKQTLTSASNSFLSNTQKLLASLDSSAFCSTLMQMYELIRSDYPEQASELYSYTVQKNITQSVCESYQDQFLNNGLTQAAFMVHQEAKKLLAEIITSSTATANVTAVEQTLTMLQLFLAPVYEGLILDLNARIGSNLDTLKAFDILFYVFYIVVAFIAHLLFWTCFLRSIEVELFKSRGMLKIMPLELIDKLRKLKRGRAEIQSFKFFKTLDKSA